MKSGFTLIETLIYIAISAMLMAALFSLFYQMTRSSDSFKQDIWAEEEGDFLIHKIKWTLQNEPEKIDNFHLQNGVLFFQDKEGDWALNSSRVMVSDYQLEFTASSTRVSFKINGHNFETMVIIVP